MGGFSVGKRGHTAIKSRKGVSAQRLSGGCPVNVGGLGLICGLLLCIAEEKKKRQLDLRMERP